VAQISQNAMREYETIYILKAELEDSSAIEFIGKMKSVVETKGGKHLQVTNWGRRKLAWERDRHQKGMMIHHRYLGQPGLVKEYERTLGIDENVLLRQTIVLNRAVDPASAVVDTDVLEPPITKEVRREERYGRDRDDEGGGGRYGRDRDRDDEGGGGGGRYNRDDDDNDNDNDND
jgi:small subunit ribosomal protein S6